MPQGSGSILAEAGATPAALRPAIPAAAPKKLRRVVWIFMECDSVTTILSFWQTRGQTALSAAARKRHAPWDRVVRPLWADPGTALSARAQKRAPWGRVVRPLWADPDRSVRAGRKNARLGAEWSGPYEFKGGGLSGVFGALCPAGWSGGAESISEFRMTLIMITTTKTSASRPRIPMRMGRRCVRAWRSPQLGHLWALRGNRLQAAVANFPRGCSGCFFHRPCAQYTTGRQGRMPPVIIE